ncbi:MAG: DUF1080 domain-containing protein [Planctomycetota bacterium]
MRTTKMQSPFFVLATLIVTSLGAQSIAHGDVPNSGDDFEKRARSLFDGENLFGWQGDGFWFRVDNGAIVAGRLDRPIPHNQFLMFNESFGDFELRLEVRLIGIGDNAGVQFRSRRPRPGETIGESDKPLPKTEMVGYQADMGTAWGRSIWGALYDESRRRRMLAEPKTPFDVTRKPLSLITETEASDDQEAVKSNGSWSTNDSSNNSASKGAMSNAAKSVANQSSPAKRQDTFFETKWVRMRIICQGNRIQIFMDDVMTVDYTETDPDIARQGHLALQIHSGPPAEAWYRNIRVLMR